MKRTRLSTAIDQQTLTTFFLDIVGGSQTPDTARQFLVATAWQLDEAIQLFYAENATGLGPCSSSNDIGDDGVRPPLPVRRESLYDDDAMLYPEDNDPNLWESEDNSNKDLATLYRPPLDLMFHGSFGKAKEAASAQNKWLMVNVQSKTEFSSHRLNRDTWAHEAVAQTIGISFVFWQSNDDTVEGRKVSTYYRLESVPAVLVIEPVTGQKMKSWFGMVEPENLVEDLVPFTDSSPKDHLVALSRKRPRPSKEAVAAPMEVEDSATATREDGVIRSSEKPELIPLPEEPEGDRRFLCRVGIRLPDGGRVQRNFLRTDPIQLLWSFCHAHLQELNDESNRFRLIWAVPGASRSLDYHKKSSFEESGIANSLISVVWEDE